MQRTIIIQNQTIPYTVRRSARARNVRIMVYGDASVVVTMPVGVGLGRADALLRQKSAWLQKTVARYLRGRDRQEAVLPYAEYGQYKARARALVHAKVRQWNALYGHVYRSIAIRNQTTRWGSCSHKCNLNFNYKIALLPEALCDYVIVHELCHLKELNHSPKFWALVAQTLPDYKQRRAALHRIALVHHHRA